MILNFKAVNRRVASSNLARGVNSFNQFYDIVTERILSELEKGATTGMVNTYER